MKISKHVASLYLRELIDIIAEKLCPLERLKLAATPLRSLHAVYTRRTNVQSRTIIFRKKWPGLSWNILSPDQNFCDRPIRQFAASMDGRLLTATRSVLGMPGRTCRADNAPPPQTGPGNGGYQQNGRCRIMSPSTD